jgi:hypothetical protein
VIARLIGFSVYRASFVEEAMFLCQPLLEVLAERGIEDIVAFL